MLPGGAPPPTPTPLPSQAPGPPPTSPVVGGVPAGTGGPTAPGSPGMGGPAPTGPGAGQGAPPGQQGILAALKAAGIDLPDDPNLEHHDLGRRSPRRGDTHIYEVVASDIAEWLNTMPKLLARAMRGGPHKQGPFKHPATGKQKYDIYKGKLFNDDGTPNMEGRKELLSKMNPQQYAQVVHIVTKEMRRDGGIAGTGGPE
jgi:hypothetical protein